MNLLDSDCNPRGCTLAQDMSEAVHVPSLDESHYKRVARNFVVGRTSYVGRLLRRRGQDSTTVKDVNMQSGTLTSWRLREMFLRRSH